MLATLLRTRAAKWVLAAVGSVALLAIAMWVTRSSGLELQITSEPPGAAIRIDEVDTGRSTPAVFTGYAPDSHHRVEIGRASCRERVCLAV